MVSQPAERNSGARKPPATRPVPKTTAVFNLDLQHSNLALVGPSQ
jgi:hypothetical protein